MNDEIKEKIDFIKQILNRNELIKCSQYFNDLLDYITNLQQANKSLTEQLEYLRSGEYLNQVKWERDLNENLNQTMSIELINYKSRCEKGIEYNNQIIKDTKDFYRPTTDIIYSGDALIEIATNNINILQNGSDDK